MVTVDETLVLKYTKKKLVAKEEKASSNELIDKEEGDKNAENITSKTSPQSITKGEKFSDVEITEIEEDSDIKTFNSAIRSLKDVLLEERNMLKSRKFDALDNINLKKRDLVGLLEIQKKKISELQKPSAKKHVTDKLLEIDLMIEYNISYASVFLYVESSRIDTLRDAVRDDSDPSPQYNKHGKESDNKNHNSFLDEKV